MQSFAERSPRRAQRLLLAAAIYAAGLSGMCGSAAAEMRHEVYAGLPPVAVEELAQMRGGISVAGLDIGFGATVRVLHDNTIIAETVLTMMDDGSLGETTTFSGGSIARPFSPDDTSGVDLSALQNARGVEIKDAEGASFALFDIGLDHTKSFLINTAAERNIRQLVDVRVEIRNFTAVQSDLLREAALQNLARIGVPDVLTD